MPTPTWIGSMHKTAGRRGYRPEAIVIHIMEGSLSGTDRWFNDPRSKVSAHYGIGRSGEVHQYVKETDTAWHCGRVYTPTWKLLKPGGVNPNLYTIGIEHEGTGNDPWSEAMYRASADLVREIGMRWNIPLDRDHVVGHREIYGQKTCPGSKVDLERLVRMARGEDAAPATDFVARAARVLTRTDLKVRRGAPNTSAPVVRIVPRGTELAFVGYTTRGQSVSGNAVWYRDAMGDYFWAGGTERPAPDQEAPLPLPG